MPLIPAVLLIIAAAIAGAMAMRLYFAASMSRVVAALRALADGNYGARVWPQPSGPASEVSYEVDRLAGIFERVLAGATLGSNRLIDALNSSIDGIAVVDETGLVVFANRALDDLLGGAAMAAVGNPAAWLLPDQHALDGIRTSRDQNARVVNLIERPGRRFWQVATTPIVGGGDWAVLIVVHDLTDVRRAELSRRDFVANVSHELRTPVAALRSVIETLADGAMDDRPVAEEFLRRADAEAERLVSLVEELLELSRIESGELPLSIKSTDVGALVRELVDRLRPIAERSRQKLTVELGEGLQDLPVDPSRIDRALVNLVQNALKFTPEGGAISVKAAHTGNDLKISVTDTGAGIAVSDLPRVFERFYKVEQSRASGGTGLGLALVKHAVEAHGGAVTAESRLGEGSTFTITVPLVESQPRAPGELQQAPAVGTQL